jgi:hypothetical protein
MFISLDRQDYPAFLLEGQKTAEIMHDPILSDIIASARAGYARAGRRGLMDRLYAKQKEYYLQGRYDGIMLAKACALMGRKQEAMQPLEEAYNRHEINVLSCLSHSDLLTLRDDPRYVALVKKINFPLHPTGPSPIYLAAIGKQPLQGSSTPH